MVLTNEMRENVETIRHSDNGKESRRELTDEASSASMERRRRRMRSVRKKRHVEMVGEYEEETKKEIDDDTSNVTIEGDQMGILPGIYPANADGGVSKNEVENEFSTVSIGAKKNEEESTSTQSQVAKVQDETEEVDELETGRISEILSEEVITNIEHIIEFHSERSKAEVKIELKEDKKPKKKQRKKQTICRPIMVAAMAPTALVAIGSLAWFAIELSKRFS